MSKLVTTAVCIWVATAVAGPAVASSVRLDLDTQNRGTDVAMERLFAGNNPDLDVYLWENGSTVLVALSQVWFSYAPLPVTGSVARVRGTYLATNAVSFVGTNVLARNGKYYWDVTRIWQRSGTASNTVTYGRGVFQVDSAHGAGASGSAVFRNVVNWDGIQNVGALPWAGGATNAALAVVNTTNALLSARITTAQARADAAAVTNAAQAITIAAKQDAATAATDAELAAASQAGTNFTRSATNAHAILTLAGGAHGGEQDTLQTVVNRSAGSATTNLPSLDGGTWAIGANGRMVRGYGVKLADISTDAFGAWQSGYNSRTQTIGTSSYGSQQDGINEGTQTIGNTVFGAQQRGNNQGTQSIVDYAHGAQQIGVNEGTQTIGSGSYGSQQAGYNDGTRSIMGSVCGSQQSGYNRGGQVIGVGAHGAQQRGSSAPTATATNNGVGAVQLLDLTAGQKALTTSGGAASLMLGAGVASNKNAIVAGDGSVSHGDGSMTASGGFWDGSARLATVGQLAATGTAVKAYCSNAANLTGTVPDASIETVVTGKVVKAMSQTRYFWTSSTNVTLSVGLTPGQVCNYALLRNTAGTAITATGRAGWVWVGGSRTNTIASGAALTLGFSVDPISKLTNAYATATANTLDAALLVGNTPYASVTSALARARAPQSLTYSGTNVYTDARLGPVFRVNATNDFRLHKPTGATDGQALKWWIKQHAGGTNTVTLVASEFVIPIGASTPVLSVTNGCVDVLAGEWDGVNSRVRVQSFMRYTQ